MPRLGFRIDGQSRAGLSEAGAYRLAEWLSRLPLAQEAGRALSDRIGAALKQSTLAKRQYVNVDFSRTDMLLAVLALVDRGGQYDRGSELDVLREAFGHLLDAEPPPDS